MGNHSVYLAGPITGLAYDKAKGGWRKAFTDKLRALASDVDVLSPMRGVGHLSNVASLEFHSENTFTTPKGCLARDRYDIERCDLIVACLPPDAERVSIGTMIEFGMAYALNKPICLIASKWPPEHFGVAGEYQSPAHHPHAHGWVYELADYRVDTFDEAVAIVAAFCSEGL